MRRGDGRAAHAARGGRRQGFRADGVGDEVGVPWEGGQCLRGVSGDWGECEGLYGVSQGEGGGGLWGVWGADGFEGGWEDGEFLSSFWERYWGAVEG